MSNPASKALVHQPPTRPSITRPAVILYGSVLSDPDKDWQTSLSSWLSDLPIDILNPRRDDWDSSWVEDISFPKFKEQVDWEMDHATIADVIVFNFVPGSLSPISLLELGMHAGTGKVVVCCPEGFYKRGNVQMVCLRYGIDMFDTPEELETKVRARLLEMVRARDEKDHL
jgi:hypothetical protein